jgi:hypothetical protein
LQQISQSGIVTKKITERIRETVGLLEAQRYDMVSAKMPRTIRWAVEVGMPMRVMQRFTENMMPFLEYELILLASRVNVDVRLNIQRGQVKDMALQLYEMFPADSLEDVSLCLRQGAQGKYGELYRIDLAVITQWMKKYLEEKAQEAETQLKSTIYEVPGVDEPLPPVNEKRNLLALLQKVIGNHTAARPSDNADANSYQRFKLTHKQPTQSEARAFVLHQEYLKKNYDIITGKKLAWWLSEDEWIEKELAKTEKP